MVQCVYAEQILVALKRLPQLFLILISIEIIMSLTQVMSKFVTLRPLEKGLRRHAAFDFTWFAVTRFVNLGSSSLSNRYKPF